MTPTKDKQLLTILMERELLERIDDYRYANRFPTRAGAIRWLLEWSLKKAPPAPRQRRPR